ncbi:MAG: hypothetical protein IJK87_15560 [Prevotella sp.]|nr:hypothetical protein [Prevotella sp.]
MDHKLTITHVMIHGFAAAHAVTAATLSQTMVGDEVALTTLTISMIIAISRLYNQPIEVGSAFALLGTFAGFYLGTRGAIFCIKWIPFVGNAANAIATTMTTETLGWVTYYIVSRGDSIGNVTKDEVKELIRKSNESKNEHEREWKRIRNIIKSMNSTDRTLYDSLMTSLKRENLSDFEQKEIEQQLTELFDKYEQ